MRTPRLLLALAALAGSVQAGVIVYAHGRIEAHVTHGFGGPLLPVFTCATAPTDAAPGFVALVLHSRKCAESERTAELKAAGAVGVVVASDSPVDSFGTLALPMAQISVEDFNVLVAQTNDLWRRDGKHSLFRIRVLPDPSRFYIFLIVLWPIIIIGLYEVAHRMKRHWASQAAKRALELIPLKIWSDINLHNSDRETACPICIEDYKNGDSIRCLPCGHDFHSVCVDKWLTSIVSLCPLCKQSVLPHQSVVDGLEYGHIIRS
ncbi:hypothetical protein BCR33DRAFT_762092 [Rhizoclosmatium globosum]|uniref:RING-type domain-containing protein n=1 Tax=Rhizoclosmatium globosum TaxID=329046 RepID=A0A1Y2CY79_9FUNG|nr:hypothetical protein BCR33DRAFT_762092 [Rhizoclosmatium globosum]|eukprot:ORY51295.1 hypothetical protein BCR33DRAFT_762092 [Rhizoclosmatium globosum]